MHVAACMRGPGRVRINAVVPEATAEQEKPAAELRKSHEHQTSSSEPPQGPPVGLGLHPEASVINVLKGRLTKTHFLISASNQTWISAEGPRQCERETLKL